jgi:hypothetical protein
MIKATGTILNGAPKAEIDSTISGHFFYIFFLYENLLEITTDIRLSL